MHTVVISLGFSNVGSGTYIERVFNPEKKKIINQKYLIAVSVIKDIINFIVATVSAHCGLTARTFTVLFGSSC